MPIDKISANATSVKREVSVTDDPVIKDPVHKFMAGLQVYYLELTQTSYDMVLLHIGMSEQHGFAVLRQLREPGSQTFVVMVTGHSAVDKVK